MKNIQRFENFNRSDKYSNILPLYERLLLETKVEFSDDFKIDLQKAFRDEKTLNVIKQLWNLQDRDLDIKRTNKDVLKVDTIPYSNMISLDGKNHTKLGRIIKLLLPDTPDRDIEEISNIWNSIRDYDTSNMKVVEGYRIKTYYDCSNYAEGYERTVLGKSCMNKMYMDVFDLYADNSNIKLLVKLDDNGKLLARALVFNTIDKGVYMDNIYSIKDKDIYTFRKYAEEKGWKTFTNRKNNDSEYEELLNVQLERSEYSLYPFLDHFSFLNIDQKVLSTQFRQWEDTGDTVIKITDHKNNKWEKIYGDESYDYEPIIYSQELPDDWEEYYDKGVLDMDTLIDYGIDYERYKRDYESSESDKIYNYVTEYIDDDEIVEYFEEQDILTQIEYAVNADYDIVERIIEDELTDEDELSDVMSKYLGEPRDYEDLEDARDDLETIAGVGLEHMEEIENLPKLFKFIQFFLDEVYDDYDDIEDYNRDNYKDVVDSNQLEDDLTTRHIENKLENLNSVTEIIEEEGRDSEEEKREILNYNWHQETFIENARQAGYDLDGLIEELKGYDEEDEDDYY
jgi:hypothetical protein